jgi:hypothetical protein
MCSASSEAMWLRNLLVGLFDIELEVNCIWRDNQSCVRLSQNPIFHDKSTHIKIRYHYNRYMVQKGEMKLHCVSIDDQIEDVLTKPLSRVKFVYFKYKLGVVQKDVPSKRE